MTARLPVTVSSVQTWFYMHAYVKKSSPGSTQLPTSRHLLSPPTCATMTHTHTHTYTHLLIACGAPWPTALGAINPPNLVCASVQAVPLGIRPSLFYFQPGPGGTGGATSPTTLQCTQPKVDQPKSLLW